MRCVGPTSVRPWTYHTAKNLFAGLSVGFVVWHSVYCRHRVSSSGDMDVSVSLCCSSAISCKFSLLQVGRRLLSGFAVLTASLFSHGYAIQAFHFSILIWSFTPYCQRKALRLHSTFFVWVYACLLVGSFPVETFALSACIDSLNYPIVVFGSPLILWVHTAPLPPS